MRTSPNPTSARSWRELGLHSGRSLVEEIERGIRTHPEARLIFGSQDRPAQMSVTQAWREAADVAAGFAALGLQPGDAIVSQLPNWRESVLVFLAALQRGLVYIPVVHIYGSTELGHVLRAAKAKALVLPDRWRKIDFGARVAALGELPNLEHIVVVGDGDVPGPSIAWPDLLARGVEPLPPHVANPDQVCMINFTSGTTSLPKGVQHTHHTLGAEIHGYPSNTMPGDPPETLLQMTPGGHIAAVISMLRPFLAGETYIYMDQFDAAHALALIDRHRPQQLGGVPAQLGAMFDLLGDDTRGIRSATTGAAGVPASLIERGQRMGITVVRMYGLTEHPTISCGGPGDSLEKRARTDGKLTRGSQIRIVDDEGIELPRGTPGEIISTGPELFVGYLDPTADADAFTPDGWFRTGDIGVLDEDGYLSIVDRKKDIIIRGGENIASREVEDILLRHPAVLEAAAVALPHPTLGECVGAFVKLRPAMRLELTDVIEHFSHAGIARQKTPEHLVIVDEFPRTPLGKIQKAELRKHRSTLAHSTGGPAP